ncbi:hypothetical protein Ahy_B06g080726 isoform G [Arachis hypogaea]|uniref:Uncharacterized protein n=1 Tax=Arachis hypogaea TaxID=3818 RepID=A0A444YIU3_ARAHY|nr:hypothetical protein Ahy_B06g080726 isoform G [Arachis hypogaea]
MSLSIISQQGKAFAESSYNISGTKFQFNTRVNECETSIDNGSQHYYNNNINLSTFSVQPSSYCGLFASTSGKEEILGSQWKVKERNVPYNYPGALEVWYHFKEKEGLGRGD